MPESRVEENRILKMCGWSEQEIRGMSAEYRAAGLATLMAARARLALALRDLRQAFAEAIGIPRILIWFCGCDWSGK